MQNTSWGKVAKWYEKTVTDDSSYQNTVIKPNLLRLLNLQKGESVLDIACGSGFFAREFSKLGAKVTGVDIGAELIAIAKQQDPKSEYIVGDAQNIVSLKNEQFDVITIVLAIQNIKNSQAVVSEISRLLKPGGRCLIVLNHPAFRVPKQSEWGYDEKKGVQYRRVDKYLSEVATAIDMAPGTSKVQKLTYSFHRPIQVYFKMFAKHGLVVSRLEEWVSNKSSDKGARQKAEDTARKEFPLFMCLELRK
jgi:ubiquinone/menaquinone biosynthesis C-methylase UbiE